MGSSGALCSTRGMDGVQRRIGTAADILITKVDQREGCLVVSGVSVGSNGCPECGQPSRSALLLLSAINCSALLTMSCRIYSRTPNVGRTHSQSRRKNFRNNPFCGLRVNKRSGGRRAWDRASEGRYGK